jgi:excisionase family DNA binding protein
MLDVKELAAELGYTPQNITRLVREGKLEFVKRGRKYYFNKSVISTIVTRSTSTTTTTGLK